MCIRDRYNAEYMGYSPEVVSKSQHFDSKLDVYSWGVMLYHFLKKESEDELRSKLGTKLSDEEYEAFLNDVKELKVEGNTVAVKMIIDVLMRVLDREPKRRPNFKELAELLKPVEVFYKQEFNSIKEMIMMMIDEKGKALKLSVVKLEEKYSEIKKKKSKNSK
eukprot:TRINITY_DN11099_c0_g1_i8.p1 TRINITY_DN11099_c0_g1~~TRINITY_DN11099_c0_g1_i8.p1  ORF type:complete len:163 (+),score=47.17 TRINITY_DN11099_c0_g1_i8:65-553(+)